MQLYRRDIDADLDRHAGITRLNLIEVELHLPHDPVTDFMNQPGLFCQLNEGGR